MRGGVMSWRRVAATALVLALAAPVPVAVPVPHGPEVPLVADTHDDQAGTTAGALAAALGLRSLEKTDRRSTAAWGWPLVGRPEVAQGYDPPAQRWLAGHRGIDLRGVEGEPVLAVDAGVVSYSGEIAGVGIVSVTHASGLRSTYQPVEERAGRGTRVARGDRLGRLRPGAQGHCALHACLHLGARRGDSYVDPTPLLQDLELSLLPVDGR